MESFITSAAAYAFHGAVSAGLPSKRTQRNIPQIITPSGTAR